MDYLLYSTEMKLFLHSNNAAELDQSFSNLGKLDNKDLIKSYKDNMQKYLK